MRYTRDSVVHVLRDCNLAISLILHIIIKLAILAIRRHVHDVTWSATVLSIVTVSVICRFVI